MLVDKQISSMLRYSTYSALNSVLVQKRLFSGGWNAAELSNIKSLLQSNQSKISWKFKPGTRRAAVLLPLCTVDNQSCVLLIKRANNLRSHAGEIAFPGGLAEEGEDAIQTAKRETLEEVGLQMIDILGNLPSLPNYNYRIKVKPIVGFVKEEFIPSKLKISKDEVEKVYCVPILKFLDKESFTMEKFRNNFEIPCWNIKMEDETIRVWGLTAAILMNFLVKLGKIK